MRAVHTDSLYYGTYDFFFFWLCLFAFSQLSVIFLLTLLSDLLSSMNSAMEEEFVFFVFPLDLASLSTHPSIPSVALIPFNSSIFADMCQQKLEIVL